MRTAPGTPVKAKGGKVIRDIEALLKAIIAAQKADPDFELNNSQKVELSIFQLLLKNSRLSLKYSSSNISKTN